MHVAVDISIVRLVRVEQVQSGEAHHIKQLAVEGERIRLELTHKEYTFFEAAPLIANVAV